MELRLLSDDAFFEELEMTENDLMDKYVADSLSTPDREALERALLKGERQQRKLAFVKALDAESSTRASASEKVKTLPARTIFSNVYFRIAACSILALGLGLVIWMLLGRKSDVDRGMIALNQAHSKERLIESRVSELNYAPVRQLRGNETGAVDSRARDYAELLLLEAVNQQGDAASYHALGRLYLAERNFEKSRQLFEQALAKNPKDAQLESDLGATLLELGQSTEGGQRVQDFSQALHHLTRALELDPSLAEALFNRALLYQHMKLPQAKEAWRKYLDRDATSPWANEAERNLKLLEAQEAKAYNKKTDLYDSFAGAYRDGDREAAWSAIRQSRSRSGNYVVEKLLDEYLSFAAAGNEKQAASALDMLSFAGDVEEQRVGDRYTYELAAFYRQQGYRQIPALTSARLLVKAAREQYDRAEFEVSSKMFAKAQTQFEAAGDHCEALFTESWIGYNELRLTSENSQRRFERLTEIYDHESYKSLLAQSLHARSDALTSLNEFSKVLDYAGRALKQAEAIEDDSTRLRCLQQFVSMNLRFGNYAESLNYGMTALELAPEFITEPKVIWTFYQEIASDLYWLDLSDAALEFQREALRLAGVADWPLIIVRSYTQLGIIHQRRGEFDDAIRAGLQAVAEGQKIQGEKSRLETISHATLRLGHIYREAGDFGDALRSYDEALRMFEQLDLGMFLYEVHKGKFMAYAGAGDNAAADAELAKALELVEEYREKIIEERNRNAFFDTGQDIYQLAIDFAYTKLNDKEKALEYAEASRARALLELIHANPQVMDKGNGPDIDLPSAVNPMPLSTIRSRMPQGLTILEYALLSDKLIVWKVTRAGTESSATAVSGEALQKQILAYEHDVATDSNREAANKSASDLYRVLISPVEKSLKDDDELCIVPDKALSNLPFSALISPDTGRFLIEKYRFVVSPSANVFIECTQGAADKTATHLETVLSVGNPSFSRKQFPGLPDLPSAAREAEQVANNYKSSPLLGRRATERDVRAGMQRAEVIHFAAHYVIDPQSPLRSKLLLSAESQSAADHQDDGVLQTFEIYGMKLRHTRLTVLSACQTGVERSYQGEGAIGIARAFIAAGVPVVVASLWPVDSDVTATLMIKFHEYRTLGLPTAEALRRAQRDMLNASDERLQQPYAWAAFEAFGGHASF